MKNKIIGLMLACLLAVGSVACAPKDKADGNKGNGDKGTQTGEVLYQMEDVTKENLLWEESLFYDRTPNESRGGDLR